jgi:hypothetical protein
MLFPLFIDFKHDPMERLLLVNFERDPDTTYKGFEPQYVNDAVNGTGYLVIGWRNDGFVDVYHEEAVKVNPGKYHITGKGFCWSYAIQFKQAFFEVTAAGVNAHFQFSDAQGREVLIKLEEKNNRKRKPFGLLAPMGYACENPKALPLIFLHEFYFVRKCKSKLEIRIDRKLHKPDKLPIPMDWSRMFFARYSPKPHIISCNEMIDYQLNYIEVIPGQSEVTRFDRTFYFIWDNGQAYLKKMKWDLPHSSFQMTFHKPVPHPDYLIEGEKEYFDFSIIEGQDTGEVGGEIEFTRLGNQLDVQVTFSKGWKPRYSKCSLRFLYTVASVFRNWIKNYCWNASFIREDGAFRLLQATWENRK